MTERIIGIYFGLVARVSDSLHSIVLGSGRRAPPAPKLRSERPARIPLRAGSIVYPKTERDAANDGLQTIFHHLRCFETPFGWSLDSLESRCSASLFARCSSGGHGMDRLDAMKVFVVAEAGALLRLPRGVARR